MEYFNLNLNKYQAFLEKNKLVAPNKRPYFARWVSKFIRFCQNDPNNMTDSHISIFLEFLGKEINIKEWQVKQADEAFRLYVEKFLG